MSNRNRRRMRQASKGPWLFVCTLILISALYLGSASVVGNWLADAIILPLVEWASGSSDISSPTPGGTQLPQTSFSTDSIGTDAVSDNLEMKAVKVFALQFGLFDTQQAAQLQADEIQSKGAAGYIAKDVSGYRVLGAAYSTQQQAQEVRDRLVADNQIECIIHPVEIAKTSFKLTAPKQQITVLEAAYQEVIDTLDQLAVMSVDFETEKITQQQCIDQALEIAQRLNAADDDLKRYVISDEDKVIDGINTLCAQTLQDIEKLCSKVNEERLLFGVQIRYNYLSILFRYRQYITEITA